METLLPLHHVLEAGFDVEIATLTGEPAKFEWWEWAMAADRPVVSLCHGPAAFLATGIGRDRSVFAGYEMCVFPDSLDAGQNIDIGYLPAAMPWLLAEALAKAGVTVVDDDMSGACTTDRNVITGDSPLVANELGRRTAVALVERAAAAG